MQNNPYTPPKTPLKDQPRVAGSPVKAILVGLAIDLGGSLLVGAIVGFLYAASLVSQGMSEADIAVALTNIPADSWMFIGGMLAGALLSFVGGFACARIAGRDEYRLGSILAFLTAGFGLAMGWESYEPMQNVLLTLSTAACVLLGTKYGRAANLA
jgi:hypothetical protein